MNFLYGGAFNKDTHKSEEAMVSLTLTLASFKGIKNTFQPLALRYGLIFL